MTKTVPQAMYLKLTSAPQTRTRKGKLPGAPDRIVRSSKLSRRMRTSPRG